MVLPVRISGLEGERFHELAHTLDVSRNGVRLGGVRRKMPVGALIEIQYRHRKSRFRVVWVKPLSSNREFQMGLQCVEREKEIWEFAEGLGDSWLDEFVLGHEGREPRQAWLGSMRAEIKQAGAQQARWYRVGRLTQDVCFCRTPKPLPAQTQVSVSLSTDEFSLGTFGVVRNCRPGEGMEIEFQPMDTLNADRLVRFLAAQQTSEPPASGTDRPLTLGRLWQVLESSTTQLKTIEELLPENGLDASVMDELRAGIAHLNEVARALQGALSTSNHAEISDAMHRLLV